MDDAGRTDVTAVENVGQYMGTRFQKGLCVITGNDTGEKVMNTKKGRYKKV